MRKYIVKTEYPIASDSNDHLYPHGTARDNSTNQYFNSKLFIWFGSSDFKVMDLGCAGGGFVKSLIDLGSDAIGIEGSDYSKKRKRAEWPIIPNSLFTADITKPFEVLCEQINGTKEKAYFDVITAWEVFEHLNEDRISQVITNIMNHLMPNGVIILSISTVSDKISDVEMHQTVRSKKWWINRLKSLGLINHRELLDVFGADWVRNEEASFHLVLTRKGEMLQKKNRIKFIRQYENIKAFLPQLQTPATQYINHSQLLVRAKMDFEKKDYIGCLQKVTEIISIEQLLPEAHYYAALSLHQSEIDYRDAEFHYNKSLELGFDPFWIKYNRGSLFMKIGRIQEALQDINDAFRINSSHVGINIIRNNIKSEYPDNEGCRFSENN